MGATLIRHSTPRSSWPRRYARAARDGLLVAVPFGGSVALARAYAHNGSLGGDYRVNAWTAGRNLFHQMNVYVAPTSPAVKHFAVFDWGPASAVALAPLSLLHSGLASAIFVVLCIAAVALTLWVLEVRDWRIYCIVFAWPFVMLGWGLGNVELLMTLGLALAWRYRDRPAVAGALVAILISVKLIVLPLVIWLVATRRYSALKHTSVWAVIVNLAALAIVGFGEIRRYVVLLRAVAKVALPRGCGVVSLCIHLGASTAVSSGVAIALALVLAFVCLRTGRRGADLSSFAIAIVIGMVATPIMQPHYYTLLLVPLAVARPRFGPIWAVPLALWVSLAVAGQWDTVDTTVVGLCMTAYFAASTLPRRQPRLAMA